MINFKSLSFILIGIFISACIQPPKSKKKNCDSLLLSNMIASEGNSCSQTHMYQCDVRIFSPDIENSEEIKEVCFGETQAQCLMTRVLSFSTEDQRSNDEYSKEEDFLFGGQYNYQEVTCYQKHKHAKGLYQIVGEGATVESALNKAKEACELDKRGGK